MFSIKVKLMNILTNIRQWSAFLCILIFFLLFVWYESCFIGCDNISLWPWFTFLFWFVIFHRFWFLWLICISGFKKMFKPFVYFLLGSLRLRVLYIFWISIHYFLSSIGSMALCHPLQHIETIFYVILHVYLLFSLLWS